MKSELKEYLKENHSANDIKQFIKELVDSPSAEDVYSEMSLAIRELSDQLIAVNRAIEG